MKHFIAVTIWLAVICAIILSCAPRTGETETAAIDTADTADTADQTTGADTARETVVYSPDGSVVGGNPSESGTADKFRVYFFNAGRADAALIDADGKYYMVDTGTADGADALCDKLDSLGVKTIEAVFLTHTHSDHIGGFKKLCKRFEVNGLFSPCYSILSNGENVIDKLAGKCGMKSIKLYGGDRVELCKDVYAEALGPLVSNGDDDNDNSLVLRINVNGRIFLLAGDMQFAEEYTLIQAGDELSADVLKVGNHGNKDATSSAFAAAVSPKIAVIPTDTGEDAESAAKRVLKEFTSAEIYITGDCDNWLLVSVAADGKLTAEQN